MDKTHGQITTNAIKSNDYDALIYVSNCQYYGTTDERDILELIAKDCKKPKIFVLNQLDKFNEEEDSIIKMLANYKSDLTSLGFHNPTIIPVSSRYAYLNRKKKESLKPQEQIEMSMFESIFSNDFWDLPYYVNNQSTPNLFERTGIKLLEQQLANLL